MSNQQSEIFEALKILEQEKKIPIEYMIDKISKAILTACKTKYNSEDAIVKIDKDTNKFSVKLYKTVVENVENPGHEISVEDAKGIDENIEIGSSVEISLNTREFGRIAAMTARNMIRQAVRDSERGILMQEYLKKCKHSFTATVERIDNRTGNAVVKINDTEMILNRNEQIDGEILTEGDHIKIYMSDVKQTDKGPRAIISRTHPDLVRKLFENEVPEISDGTVEIKAIAREPGARTKIAVLSNNENVDAIGTCIGSRGVRIENVVNELNGEKIDIVEYNENPKEFVREALAPADVLNVEIENESAKICKATVPDSQISLAIGNKGQNVRLAAKLTGYRIDIVPESGFYMGDYTE
jgi:N utilization substance protein A